MCEEKKQNGTVDTKEVDSMERAGYKRLDMNSLNFANDKNVNEKSVEDITPIKWSKEVLSGKKQVIIRKK